MKGDRSIATLLNPGDIYHEDGDTRYFRAVTVTRIGTLVNVTHEDRSTGHYYMTTPVVIVHYAGQPGIPPATDFEFQDL